MKTKALIVLLLIFKLVHAQIGSKQIIDSLENQLLSQVNDSNRVKTLDKLAFRYSTLNPETGIKFAEEALKIPKSINWSKGIGLSYLDLGMNYSKSSNNEKAIDFSFKAIALKEYLNPLSEAIINENLGTIYLEQKNYDKTRYYYKSAQEFDHKIKNIILEASDNSEKE